MYQFEHRSVDERVALGRSARSRTPRSAHANWQRAADAPDPAALLIAQNATREPDLVPVRHGRMSVSPLAFYRGAAAVMAADLSATPVSGLNVQLCGDAHLSNFGAFASPERQLIFDLNDFDETLPGPFEYDVKRMATSFVVAARNNKQSNADARAATLASVTSYREAMLNFAGMRTMDIWYARLDEDDIRRGIRSIVKSASPAKKNGQRDAVQRAARRAQGRLAKAHTRDSLQALSELGEQVDGRYRIVSRQPIVVPARDLATAFGLSPQRVGRVVGEQFRAYRATLPDDRRTLLERFDIVDVARKVVGVGSVGTRAFIVLLQGRDMHDPLFLQVKEASASVLEAYLGRSRYRNHGARVVQGQRLMQAASDIFLGWTKGEDGNRCFYWRQLRDMKMSADVERMTPTGLTFYGRICGWTLARAHARSGDPVAIAAYLGSGDAFDRSVVDFARRYADQNERDFEEFRSLIRAGHLEATEGV